MITLLVSMALAGPQPVTWQGRLLDVLGRPVDGQQATTLRLYDVPLNGSHLHQETDLLPFSNGYASTLLGDDPSNPLLDSYLDGRALYVEVEIAGAVLTPRQRIGGALLASGGTNSDPFGTIYDSPNDALEDGLLAYLDYDAPNGCEGSQIADRMSYLTATCNGTGIRVPGAVGMAIDRTTGVQHGVTIDFPDNDTYDTFTASLWFRPTSTSCHAASTDCAGILWMSDNSAQSMVGFLSRTVPAGVTWGAFPNATNANSGVTRATDLQWTPGEWHHMVVTMNAGTGESVFYLNGQILDQRSDYAFQLGPRAAVANYFTLTGGTPMVTTREALPTSSQSGIVPCRARKSWRFTPPRALVDSSPCR